MNPDLDPLKALERRRQLLQQYLAQARMGQGGILRGLQRTRGKAPMSMLANSNIRNAQASPELLALLAARGAGPGAQQDPGFQRAAFDPRMLNPNMAGLQATASSPLGAAPVRLLYR